MHGESPPPPRSRQPHCAARASLPCVQVAGLWILQAGAVGVGLVLVLLHIFHVRFTRPVLGQTLTKARCVVSGAPSGKPMAPAA